MPHNNSIYRIKHLKKKKQEYEMHAERSPVLLNCSQFGQCGAGQHMRASTSILAPYLRSSSTHSSNLGRKRNYYSFFKCKMKVVIIWKEMTLDSRLEKTNEEKNHKMKSTHIRKLIKRTHPFVRCCGREDERKLPGASAE